MTIYGRIRDEKLQYNINREAAKMSALSSVKIDKYEYLSGEEILPSNQKQIKEQPKFTYSPLGKAFEKKKKKIEDQEQKKVDALKDLKPKRQTKANGDKSDDKNNQSKTSEIFNDLNEKRKNILNELYENVDMNKLCFKYEGSTKDLNFNEYYDSKQFFNGIINQHVKFDDALKKRVVEENKESKNW